MPSPIETQFLTAWHHRFPHMPLATEYPVYNGRYRIDFAHPATKVAVELDGYEYHNDRDAFTSDRQRDRALQRDSWRVLHFSGREVYHDADACVREVYAVIMQHASHVQPVFVPPLQQHHSWSTKPLNDASLFGTSRPGNGLARGCATVFCMACVLLFALCMLAGLFSR